MTTSVHMRSISVHVLFVVRLRYMRSTISVHHYVDIGTSQENVNFLCRRSKKWPVDVSLFLVCVATPLLCNQTLLFVHDISHWPPPTVHNKKKYRSGLYRYFVCTESDCTDSDIQCTETGCTEKTCTESVCTEIVMCRKRRTPPLTISLTVTLTITNRSTVVESNSVVVVLGSVAVNSQTGAHQCPYVDGSFRQPRATVITAHGHLLTPV